MDLGKQAQLAIWQMNQLTDGLKLAGVSESQINIAYDYASKQTIDDFYKEHDPFKNGGTAP